MHNLISKVKDYIHDHKLLGEHEHVGVALSGGADSVCLLRVLQSLGYSVTALHCNFHLRGEESDEDEAFVTALCQQLDIPLRVTHFSTAEYARKHGFSIEMAARDLRYEWFAHQAVDLGLRSIAVAHHRDDQAETLLLNLVRGTGIRGLCGMHPRQGLYIRPMLCIGREDIQHALSSIGQQYRTDSTNMEREARRNIIRLDILPALHLQNPRIAESLAQTAEYMQETLPYYEEGIQSASARCGITCDRLHIPTFIHNGASMTLLHEWLSPYGFTKSQISDIARGLLRQSGALYETKTHSVVRDRDCLILSKRERGSIPLTALDHEGITDLGELGQIRCTIHEANSPLPIGPQYAWLDNDLLNSPLQVRCATTGDRMHPFGMKGSKLVSDLMTERKLTRIEKLRQLVVLSGTDIVWLVGVRSDHRYRVTDSTKQVLLLEWLR